MDQELIRWPGFGIPSLKREWDRFFQGLPLEIPFAAIGEWDPAIDVSETADAYTIQAELPGIDPKDIDIQVSDDVITLRGERKQEQEEKKGDYLRKERIYGAFCRSVRLPSPVDAKSVDARYSAGILKIRMPKTEQGGRKKIAIKVE
jgi:HSP20 family protein